MTAVVHRTGSVVDAIDLFCGFGGSSQGIHAAGAEVRIAANHNPLAIDCHAANYPNVDHRRADLSNTDAADYLDPADLPPARYLWASPSCKFHSPANAKKLYQEGPQARLFHDGEEFDEELYATSERSRVTMLCPLRYAAKHLPEIVVIENVVEAAQWGPGRDGSTMRWWLNEWVKLGYEHDVLFLNSMFFPPTPQSRDRMYVVLWRRGNRRPDLDYRPTACCTSDRCAGAVVQAVQTWKQRTAAWPLERWGKYGTQYTYTCPRCRARVEPVAWPAYSVIDWTKLGPAIGERESLGLKPLADSTMERIRRGLAKFRGGPPVIIPAKAVWGTDHPVSSPFNAQTTQQDKALVIDGMVVPLSTHQQARHAAADRVGTIVAGNIGRALVAPLRSGRPRAENVVDPLSTIVANGSRRAFVVKGNGSIDEAKYRARPITDPVGALTAHPAQQLATEGVGLPVYGHTYERPGQVRSRPLAEPLFTQHTTMAFGFAHMPFVTEMRGGGSNERSAADAAATITASGLHHGVLSPAIFQKINGGPGDTAWHHVGDALNTITGRDTTGLVVLPWIDQWCSDPIGVTEQLAAVLTHARHALASVPGVAVESITRDDLDRVRFRMLEPDPELRGGMGFERNYVLLGNKSEMTAGLGNAVTPPVATWISRQCLATLDDERRAA